MSFGSHAGQASICVALSKCKYWSETSGGRSDQREGRYQVVGPGTDASNKRAPHREGLYTARTSFILKLICNASGRNLVETETDARSRRRDDAGRPEARFI